MDRYPSIGDMGLSAICRPRARDHRWHHRLVLLSAFRFAEHLRSLLDAEKGGFFRIAPAADSYVSRQLYLPDTAVLITRFMTPDGVGELAGLHAGDRGCAADRHRLVRVPRVARGPMRFVVEVQPRFDYGRASHKIEISPTWARSSTLRTAPS